LTIEGLTIDRRPLTIEGLTIDHCRPLVIDFFIIVFNGQSSMANGQSNQWSIVNGQSSMVKGRPGRL
jgi:hypothetical protein